MKRAREQDKTRTEKHFKAAQGCLPGVSCMKDDCVPLCACCLPGPSHIPMWFCSSTELTRSHTNRWRFSVPSRSRFRCEQMPVLRKLPFWQGSWHAHHHPLLHGPLRSLLHMHCESMAVSPKCFASLATWRKKLFDYFTRFKWDVKSSVRILC